MKQIDTVLNRFFDNKKPLKTKWSAHRVSENNVEYLYLYHYHHVVLVFRLDINKIEYEWYECPADKRGLNSAKKYLSNRFNI